MGDDLTPLPEFPGVSNDVLSETKNPSTPEKVSPVREPVRPVKTAVVEPVKEVEPVIEEVKATPAMVKQEEKPAEKLKEVKKEEPKAEVKKDTAKNEDDGNNKALNDLDNKLTVLKERGNLHYKKK